MFRVSGNRKAVATGLDVMFLELNVTVAKTPGINNARNSVTVQFGTKKHTTGTFASICSTESLIEVVILIERSTRTVPLETLLLASLLIRPTRIQMVGLVPITKHLTITLIGIKTYGYGSDVTMALRQPFVGTNLIPVLARKSISLIHAQSSFI